MAAPMKPWQVNNQEPAEPWSQLFMGDQEEKHSFSSDDQYHLQGHESFGYACSYSSSSFHGNDLAVASGSPWSHQVVLPVVAASPLSCVTTASMLDFSKQQNKVVEKRQFAQSADQSSECNSRAAGEAFKKARRGVHASAQSSFKVRKEKLGDRITALHQLVSPFGKTDTASVLLEAIGYIRFLQTQIQALSSPCLGGGQITNSSKRQLAAGDEEEEAIRKDLRSRGLCLVPVSCTLHIGGHNGADYWAPAPFGGGGGYR